MRRYIYQKFTLKTVGATYCICFGFRVELLLLTTCFNNLDLLRPVIKTSALTVCATPRGNFYFHFNASIQFVTFGFRVRATYVLQYTQSYFISLSCVDPVVSGVYSILSCVIAISYLAWIPSGSSLIHQAFCIYVSMSCAYLSESSYSDYNLSTLSYFKLQCKINILKSNFYSSVNTCTNNF